MSVEFGSRPLNFLMSTSRARNISDEFLTYGVRNLVDQVTGERNNYVIYNNHPDLHTQRIRAGSPRSNMDERDLTENVRYLVQVGSTARAERRRLNQSVSVSLPDCPHRSRVRPSQNTTLMPSNCFRRCRSNTPAN